MMVLSARAEKPQDPLRFIPDHADLIVKIENPRQLIKSVLGLEPVKQLLEMPAVQELYDSTNSRRFYQLVAYFEKELGMKWEEIIDRLAGGGAALGVKLGPNPPIGAAIQGKDEDLLKKFVQLMSGVIDQELGRQESRDKLQKAQYRNIATYKVGELNAAAAGTALFLANSEKELQNVIDLHLDGKKNMTGVASLGEARQLLPASPLAWLWLNLDFVHNAPQAKEVFAQPRNDPQLTIFAGGLLDVVRRSSFICGAFNLNQNRLVTTLRMPVGREGMPTEMAIHIPTTENQGCLPLLEPQRVLLSTSYYADLGKIWECRHKLFNTDQAKAFEDIDKKSGAFLLGNPVNKLLTQVGTHQRFVVVMDGTPGAINSPEQIFSKLAFGITVDMRDPGFARAVETLVRAGGLLFRTQVKLTLVEEKYKDVTILGFRFPEADPKTVPPNGLGANLKFLIANGLTPSFAVAGNQIVLTSKLELCRELVDLVLEEAKAPAQDQSASDRTRFYSSGGSELLKALGNQLFTQAILDRAVSPKEANEQIAQFIQWVGGLGALDFETHYGAKDWRFDFTWSFSGKNKETKASPGPGK
ncbi:MAG TPA: hypothetical protein VGY77_01665 [Gemmataceae bacterium]|nr:hypothetical protein [Gemmataceae bacterium]